MLCSVVEADTALTTFGDLSFVRTVTVIGLPPWRKSKYNHAADPLPIQPVSYNEEDLRLGHAREDLVIWRDA